VSTHPSVEQLVERIGRLRERIAQIGRPDVRIVAVTKYQDTETARATLAAGLSDLGESDTRELVRKVDALADEEVSWHFVGRLQTNKARFLAGRVSLLHSVDRPALVDVLARRAPEVPVLLQVDLAGLPGRGGCSWEDLEPLLERARAAGLEVQGLMGVAAPIRVPEDRQAVRVSFERLATRAAELGLAELSMGMSADLDEALAAGATIIRVGSMLFGGGTVRDTGGAVPSAEESE
jgi:pyridoxal phosphate enzyme (YggS family)